MYKDMQFDTWQQGLLHLLVVIALPILPIIVYIVTKKVCDSYWFVLLLTVVFSFIYEFMSFSTSNCSKFLKIEKFVCCLALIVMAIWAMFILFILNEEPNNELGTIRASNIILLCLFIVPVVTTCIEIIRTLIWDIKASEVENGRNSISKGASSV